MADSATMAREIADRMPVRQLLDLWGLDGVTPSTNEWINRLREHVAQNYSSLPEDTLVLMVEDMRTENGQSPSKE